VTGPEFPHISLTRAELAQASRIAAAVSTQTRGNHAAAWRHLAAALHELAEQRDPAHRPCGCDDETTCEQHEQQRRAEQRRYRSRASGRRPW
jgi:hypothetical protein